MKDWGFNFCTFRSTQYERLPLYTDLETIHGKRAPKQKDVDDDALLNASFYLRSLPKLSVKSALNGIGRRPGKHFFLVSSERGDLLMTTTPKGPKCRLSLATENGKYAFAQVNNLMDVACCWCMMYGILYCAVSFVC